VAPGNSTPQGTPCQQRPFGTKELGVAKQVVVSVNAVVGAHSQGLPEIRSSSLCLK